MQKSTISILLMTVFLLTISSNNTFSREGMWIPATLKKHEATLKKQGLLLSVNKLYNAEGSGLNNAVVLFGGGCTGSFISSEGLILTNHHCGYGYGQRLSTPERNLLIDGFWAKNKEEELPCPGLSVTITRKMENVTHYILKEFPEDITEQKRNEIIQKRISYIKESYKYLHHFDAEVKSFYDGNEYWVMMTQTFKDVRMVAFPPNSIGKFGSDIDNWEWPRHTGDFAMFRVYADKDNNPAEYDASNTVFKPEVFLPISKSGYQKGDFAMVYGFPYLTEEYLTSFELKRVMNYMYPIRVSVRGRKLKVWDSAMAANPDIFLKYASKQASISNGYKKWKGAAIGLAGNQVLTKKEAYEIKFKNKAARDTNAEEMKMLLPQMAAWVQGNQNALVATEYIREIVFGIELVGQGSILSGVLNAYRSNANETTFKEQAEKLQKRIDGFYKNYIPGLDKEVFKAIMPTYIQQNDNVSPPEVKKQFLMAGNSYATWANMIIDESILGNRESIDALLGNYNPADTALILKDPLFKLYNAVMQFNKETVAPAMKLYNEKMTPLKRTFTAKKIDYAYPLNNDFYPDANQTLRLAYGNIEPLKLERSNIWQTTLADLVARHDSKVEELKVPEKLKTLHSEKDYGTWGIEDKTMPVNFITTSHTSGGNSGSPVLNAKGELIGLNFDRPWQGTMSDHYFSDEVCRNISVDIRYVMFILEKYGEADWLFKEMKFTK